jgi:hypothetical protein
LGQVLSKGPLFGDESRLLRVGSYVKKEFVFGIVGGSLTPGRLLTRREESEVANEWEADKRSESGAS